MRRRLQHAAVVVCLALGADPVAFADDPAARQAQAWSAYRSRTEARINAETASSVAFLGSAFLPPADRVKFEASVMARQVPVLIKTTRDERGKAMEVPSSDVHHRLGAVLLPGARLDAVLAFVQDYDQHARLFSDLEASRLLRRQGEVFDIELAIRVAKPQSVRYRTEHHVVYRRLNPSRVISFSTAGLVAEYVGGSAATLPRGSGSGILKEMSSYWRFEQRAEGVVVECETINLSRDIPFLLRPFIRGYIQSIATGSVRRMLLQLRDGFAARPKVAAPAFD